MDIDNQSIVSGNCHKLTITTPVVHKIPEEVEFDGGELVPENGRTFIVSDGYCNGQELNTQDKVKFIEVERTGYYKITSNGSGRVSKTPVTKQVTQEGFSKEDPEPVQILSSDMVDSNNAEKSYYIKKSTIGMNFVTPSDQNQFITITEGYYPEDRSVIFYAMQRTTPTTSFSSNELPTYFTVSNSSDYDVEIVPTYSNTAGYVTPNTNTNNGGKKYYKIKRTDITKTPTTINGNVVSRGQATWNEGWINEGSIPAAAFAGEPTAGTEYVDISDTAEIPALQPDGCLYINAGYVDNIKIDLNKILNRSGQQNG